MPQQLEAALRFAPVDSISLAAFADLFTRTFEGYWYPVAATAAQLATRVRVEQLDLAHSVVMLLDDEPVGQALLGLRGPQAWCGGFGVVRPLRGRGLAHPLGQALLEQARLAGATHCSLEVLTRNRPAIQTYRRLGFEVVGDVQIFEWAASGASAPRHAGVDEGDLVAMPVRDLLQHWAATHPAAAAWQRDLPALLVRSALQGLGYTNQAGQQAYVLFSVSDAAARIEDLGAARFEDAVCVLQELQSRYPRLVSVNEPAESPISAAYGACSFREADRQHVMSIRL